MIAIALVLAVGVGVVLGALGGGGSVLALPILLHVLDRDERQAIAGSLFIVAVTATVAGLRQARAGNVAWPVALPFASGAMVSAWAAGRFSHHLPASVLVVLFALMMLGTAQAMWRGPRASTTARAPAGAPALLVMGAAVGAIAGLVGAGGGFLVVPALTLGAGLSMPRAVGSSLIVIALQSFAGWLGHASHVDVDGVIVAAAAAAVAGSFAGVAVGRRLPVLALRRGFAVLIVLTALALLVGQGRAA